ncbi:MAG: cytidine deaminase [Rhodobacteraceae bacterium]|nr:cytidine deaminase [Paracoccaceae bacterium]
MSLIDAAAQVRENAHAPYSRFKVGAAIRAASGVVYVGCNVENASYPEGTCAEAGAIAAMVAAGETDIAEVAVIANGPDPVAPCGGCRQRLMEFSTPEVQVTMATVAGAVKVVRLGDLLPGAFTSSQLDGH